MRALSQALCDVGLSVCAHAEDSSSAAAAARIHAPAVALLDTQLPGDGIAVARRIAGRSSAVSIIMLGDLSSRDDLIESLRAGARGYLSRDLDPSALAASARGVLNGEAALPRMLMSAVIEELRRSPLPVAETEDVATADRLTRREHDVLMLMGRGCSTAEIGVQLFISKVTVRTHVSAVLRKLEVRDRPSAVLAMAKMMPPELESTA